MPLDREARFLLAHPAAVVGDLDELAAAEREVDLDPARAGIDRILDQLLDDRCRALDDLARRDLVDQIRGKYADPRTGLLAGNQGHGGIVKQGPEKQGLGARD